MFQSQTGFPGHLAALRFWRGALSFVMFQSQTGFPGHLAMLAWMLTWAIALRFNPRRASQAI